MPKVDIFLREEIKTGAERKSAEPFSLLIHEESDVAVDGGALMIKAHGPTYSSRIFIVPMQAIKYAVVKEF